MKTTQAVPKDVKGVTPYHTMTALQKRGWKRIQKAGLVNMFQHPVNDNLLIRVGMDPNDQWAQQARSCRREGAHEPEGFAVRVHDLVELEEGEVPTPHNIALIEKLDEEGAEKALSSNPQQAKLCSV